MTWRKSSYSSVNGGNCVEVGIWRKSTYSTSNGGDCVEIGTWRKSSHSGSNDQNCLEAATLGPAVAVRDTKDNGEGPVLRFTPRTWTTFTATLR
ncbi:MAG TPA: DUF397 domain-containing protein [Trebonia sp.]|nr:DUF397 domain-containing protein [Trebonia sp.]